MRRRRLRMPCGEMLKSGVLMKIKSDVYGFLHCMLLPVVAEYEVWRRTHGYPEGTVTAVMDGDHSPKSWHYEGRAVDLRTMDMTPEDIEKMFNWLRGLYPHSDGFDVVLESTHLHVEYEGRREVRK